MNYKLCIAEKPSVAKDIARVIGANKRENGYFIGNGYIVTWAIGHLVGLAEPEEYGFVSKNDMWNKDTPQFKDKAYMELPLFPNTFKTIVLEPTKDQFDIIKSLMHRNDVELIIDCGDMGAEGHILQWLIREKADNKKPVKRFCNTSLTEEAINTSMSNLRDIDEFKGIILGEFCKKRADWILGMSMSRCASIKYNARVDVGRVQSPTLYFVLKRFLDVNNFIIKDYYQIKTELIEGFNVSFTKDNQHFISPLDKDSDNRLINKSVADCLSKEIKNLKTGIISDLNLNHKAVDRPQLYDITELQRDGNRLYNYTASDVLETAQSLYETHKILSYPRTDSRYITTDLVPYMSSRILEISSISKYNAISKNILNLGLNINKKIVDDNKVTDHHALIVTEKIQDFDISKLSDIEKNILHLVISRMLIAFSHKYTYDETIVSVSFSNGIVFSASGKKPISMGWKAVHKSLLGNENQDNTIQEDSEIFPNIKKGQIVNIKDVKVLSKKTTPPKYHTEATLLTAMEMAGSSIENGSILKNKGIGTQATRANIIKSLFDKKYIANKQIGKKNYLIPTKHGINVIKVIPKELYSPKITADWENKIARIVKGELTETDFLNDFKNFITEKVNYVKSTSVDNVDFSFSKEEFAKCPWCHSSVFKGTLKNEEDNEIESYYCSNKCGFSIQKNNFIFVSRTKRQLTTSQIKKLIEVGSISAVCKSKSGTDYKGVFKLVKTPNGYASLEFGFESKKKPKRAFKKRAK